MRGPWEEDPLLLAPGRPRRRPGAGRIEGPHDEERAPWLSEADSLLRRCGPRDTPTLGICLGMELLTVACGGKRHSETPEVGLCELTPLLPASRDELFALLADLDEPVRAVQWHWEETEILPDGAVPLLTSARCAHPAYRMGTSVWGVRFHPEAPAADIADRGGSDDGPLRALGLDPSSVVARVACEEERLRARWGAFAERWADIVVSRRAPVSLP
ncbi:gamma-glutamyl-gamma-aminobutyrate hydrolase family protein [Streptomyces sp. RK76]|nr:gamma-glutamyl-gamma-aminobutyrate hydrolase family protein [Streptomyces sp. RK76]